MLLRDPSYGKNSGNPIAIAVTFVSCQLLTRLQVYQPGSVLGLARFLSLKSASVSSDSEAVGRALVGHPALQEVTLRHIPRPAKKQKHKYKKLLHFAMHFAMDQYHTAPGCSR